MSCNSFSVMAILVAMNLILISSAKPTIDDLKHVGAKRLILTKVDSWSDHQTAIHNKENSNIPFIGDLIVGSRRDGETELKGRFSEENLTSEVRFGTALIGAGAGEGVFHYVSIVNDDGSYMVVCAVSETLGDKYFEFSYRLYPNSSANYTIHAATHLE